VLDNDETMNELASTAAAAADINPIQDARDRDL
jgi:hypothetical protein